MSEKFYPPSKEKLEILRQSGIFVLSRDLISLFVVLSFVLSSLYFFNNYLDQFIVLFRNSLLEQRDYRKLFPAFFKLLIKSVLIFLMPMVISTILAVLVQSKFLISFAFFRMRFDDLFGELQRFWANGQKNALISFLSILKVTILFFFLYFILVNLIEVEILEYSFIQLVQDRNSLFKLCLTLQSVLIRTFFLSLLLMTIISVFSLLFSHIYFRKVHAMTTREFLAEDE